MRKMIIKDTFLGTIECDVLSKEMLGEQRYKYLLKFKDNIFVYIWDNNTHESTITTLNLNDITTIIASLKPKVKCTCMCHSNPGVMHIVACCDSDGYKFN